MHGSLMPPTTRDLPTWLRFVKLCQSSEQIDRGCNRLPLSLKTMTALGARSNDVRTFCGAPITRGGRPTFILYNVSSCYSLTFWLSRDLVNGYAESL